MEKFHRQIREAIKTIYLDSGPGYGKKEGEAEDVALIVLSLLDFAFHLLYIDPESLDKGRPERLLRLAFRGLAPQINSDQEGYYTYE
jgi:hypothetical protein